MNNLDYFAYLGRYGDTIGGYSMNSSAILKFIATSDTRYRVKEIEHTYVIFMVSGLSSVVQEWNQEKIDQTNNS